MANTRIQIEVEDWICKNWLPAKFGQRFHRDRLRLISGGVFDYDAVSEDGRIVIVVSTSGARTSSGKYGAGKMMKIRSDLYFLLLVQADRRVIVFTEREMLDQFKKELDGGRIPKEIEYYLADIPDDLRVKLEAARRFSIDEMAPRKIP